MKRTSIALLLILTVLTAGVSAMERPKPVRSPIGPPGLEAPDRAPMLRQQRQRLQQEINGLTKEHETLVNELEKIKALAVKADATEAASRIDRLIEDRQVAYDSRIEALKTRQQRFERMAQRRAGDVEPLTGRGKPAPDFELTSFDGKTVSLSDYRDKVVVLEWFNCECPFSKYHHETKNTMVELAKKYKDKGVVWLAVNSTNHTTPEANIAFAKKNKVPYPILDDRSGKVGRAFGAKTTPHMFVIDHGAIVYEGSVDNAPMGRIQGQDKPVNYVDQVLAKLTAGQEVQPTSNRPYGCSVKYKAK